MAYPGIARQIASLIEIIEDTAEAYEALKNLDGLPEAFQEARRGRYEMLGFS